MGSPFDSSETVKRVTGNDVYLLSTREMFTCTKLQGESARNPLF